MNEIVKKVFFVQEIAKDDYETEGIWCIKDGEYFVIDNIPFVAKRISLGDTIKVEYDEADKAYYFDDFFAVSGNSTIRLYFDKEHLIAKVREQLLRLGCESEAFLTRKIIAVNVPKNINYRPVKKYLDDGESLKQWTYEESCLAHEY